MQGQWPKIICKPNLRYLRIRLKLCSRMQLIGPWSFCPIYMYHHWRSRKGERCSIRKRLNSFPPRSLTKQWDLQRSHSQIAHSMIELLYRIWANDLGAIWPIHKTSSVAGVFSTIIPTWISSQFLLGCKNYEVSHPTMQKHTIGQIFIPSMTYLDTTRLSLSTLTPLLPFTGKGWTRLAKRKIKNVCSGMCSICVHLPAHLIFTINELFVYLIGSFNPQP